MHTGSSRSAKCQPVTLKDRVTDEHQDASLIKRWLQTAPVLTWFYKEASEVITIRDDVTNVILRLPISDGALLRYVDPPDRELIVSSLRQSLSENVPLHLEFKYTREGKPGRLLAIGAPVTISTERMVVGIALDASKFSGDEQNPAQASNMDRTPQFAGVLAHELHNPLAAVTNAFYLLQQNSEIGDDARNYLRLASEGLDRVNRITKFLLGLYDQGESPKASIIADLVEAALEECTRQADASRFRIHRNYEFAPMIEVFEKQLERAMSAVVRNALESCRAECDLTVHTFCGRSAHARSGRGVWVVMADNGPGVPADVRNKLTEPFVTTKTEPGRGLGLWSAKWIVKKHHGLLLIHSSTASGHSGTSVGIFIPEQA